MVYAKLNRIALPLRKNKVVKFAAEQSIALIKVLQPPLAPILPGYRVKILDGNCLKATQHRLKVTHEKGAAPLPGKSLAMYDPQLGVILDILPCEDGHAQERSLLSEVIDQIDANDLWIADRNFCVTHFLHRIARLKGYFIIRYHANLTCSALSELMAVECCESGALFEQLVTVTNTAGDVLQLRRIVLQLYTPTTDGENEIILLPYFCRKRCKGKGFLF